MLLKSYKEIIENKTGPNTKFYLKLCIIKYLKEIINKNMFKYFKEEMCNMIEFNSKMTYNINNEIIHSNYILRQDLNFKTAMNIKKNFNINKGGMTGYQDRHIRCLSYNEFNKIN